MCNCYQCTAYDHNVWGGFFILKYLDGDNLKCSTLALIGSPSSPETTSLCLAYEIHNIADL